MSFSSLTHKEDAGDGFLVREAVQKLSKEIARAERYFLQYGREGPSAKRFEKNLGTDTMLLEEIRKVLPRVWDRDFKLPDKLRAHLKEAMHRVE